ncbi:MAG TPA: hypothetical protein VFD01_01985 [Candidatus Dormibacteraeota bacterium]|jgi:hypothetical protein|nr:hypothetical protein [Candidatus Dormibacteraeota bacterium]
MDIAILWTATQPVSIGLPSVDGSSILLRLIALLPLIGGYMAAREGRGRLPFEIIAVIFLVLATTIPATATMTTLPSLGPAILSRLPVVLLLLGFAFVRDGSFKMILGLALIAISGLLLLPHA